MHSLPTTDTDTVPTTEEPRFALSASPTRPSHAHMYKQHLGRPSDALSDPKTPFFDDSTHPQHAHATRSGKHAADNVSLRDLRIETADGHLTPEINPRETNSAQSIDRKRQPAKIPRELGPHPTPNTHTNTHTHPSPSAHNGRKTKARCNSSALSCNNDKVP